MTIIVHRGLNQIGGCITEISTATTRIFVDFGQNLPGVGTPSSPEQDETMVKEIFFRNPKEFQAVFYTHAHEDHVGLFFYIPEQVPQYISEGAKEMLLAKYKLIRKGLDSSTDINDKEDILCEIDQKIEKLIRFNTWKRPNPQKVAMSITIGDIRVTPFFNCHSIYDSYMFLIESEGERIWHMGDYREHGYLGKGLFPTLCRYATDIDVLITEGTMLSRNDKCIHEREVSRMMEKRMKTYKYVVVLASSTDIERLASVKEACILSGKKLYTSGAYMSRMMRLFSEREAKMSKGLFDFHAKYVSFEDKNIPLMRRNGFVLVTGVSGLDFAKGLCLGLNPEEVTLIYSAWDGYYTDPLQIKANPTYKCFRDAFPNVVDIHTSGHADRETIQRVVDTVKPKRILVIHKDGMSSLVGILN